MILCVCTGYNHTALRNDIKNDQKLKEIIHSQKAATQCKKCCSCLKEEYKVEHKAFQELLMIAGQKEMIDNTVSNPLKLKMV